MSDTTTRTHHRVCHLCEAMCGLVIQTEGDKVTDIRGDKDDPLSRGHVCPKAVALQDIHEDPDRLRKPMKRVRSAPGEYQHVEIEWSEALDLAADALASTIEKRGVDAIGAYFGNPSVHNYGMLTHQRNLFRHIRTRNRFSATSVDQLPHHLVSLWCYGHMLLPPIQSSIVRRYKPRSFLIRCRATMRLARRKRVLVKPPRFSSPFLTICC